MNQKVVFIWQRWSWKSKIWEKVAERLNKSFVDWDDALNEQMQGESISDYVKRINWYHLRKTQEHPVFKSLMEWDKDIISLGGGTTTFWEVENLNTSETFSSEVNAEILRSSWAIVIYLEATPEVLAERVENDLKNIENRPSLSEDEETVLEEATRIYEERDPKYKEQATHIINTVDKTIDEVVDEIVGLLEKEIA